MPQPRLCQSPIRPNRPLAAAAIVMGSLACLPMAAANTAVQDWASVDQETQMIARALGREATPIDRRIKLAKCPEKPNVMATDSSNLAVRCEALGWRLRVAMRGQGHEASIPYAVQTANALPNRERAAPPVVKRGDVVRISIETQQYAVSYPATATQDGRTGEAISFRGADPKNNIVAIITGPGRATISR